MNASNTFSSSSLGTPRPELSTSIRSLLTTFVEMAARTWTCPFSLKRTALMITAVMRLGDARRVDEEPRHARLDLPHDVHPRPDGELLRVEDCAHHHVADHRELGGELKLAGLGAGRVEDRLDEDEELAPALLDDGEALLLPSVSSLRRTSSAKPRIELSGAFQVVADRGEEEPAHALGGGARDRSTSPALPRTRGRLRRARSIASSSEATD